MRTSHKVFSALRERDKKAVLNRLPLRVQLERLEVAGHFSLNKQVIGDPMGKNPGMLNDGEFLTSTSFPLRLFLVFCQDSLTLPGMELHGVHQGDMLAEQGSCPGGFAVAEG